jgi:uncharacterized protein YhhL (DUF1145 family)
MAVVYAVVVVEVAEPWVSDIEIALRVARAFGVG